MRRRVIDVHLKIRYMSMLFIPPVSTQMSTFAKKRSETDTLSLSHSLPPPSRKKNRNRTMTPEPSGLAWRCGPLQMPASSWTCEMSRTDGLRLTKKTLGPLFLVGWNEHQFSAWSKLVCFEDEQRRVPTVHTNSIRRVLFSNLK